MDDALVRAERDGAVWTLTLDSPRNRNALSRALLRQLREQVDAAGADEDARAIVLRATGPAFCSGADLAEAATADQAAQQRTSELMLAALRAVVAAPVPVVAVVHGPVRAGGIGLVAAVDAAIVADDVTFAIGEVRLGLAPAVISAVVTPRLTTRDASRLMLTGEPFDAGQAARIGLITTAVTRAELDAAADHLVGQLVVSPRQGLAATKQLLNRPLVERIDRDGPALGELSARLFQSDTAQARLREFLDRRR